MNISLENAFFGKPFRTKDGKKALFLKWTMEIGPHNFYEFAIKHNGDGYDIKQLPDSEIISEWQEAVSNEELDRRAENSIPTNPINNDGRRAKWYRDSYKAGYKQGYRDGCQQTLHDIC